MPTNLEILPTLLADIPDYELVEVAYQSSEEEVAYQSSEEVAYQSSDIAIDTMAHRLFRHDIALVGLGYVGLPTALAFHAAHQRVLGLDTSTARLEAIRDERADLLGSDRDRLKTALRDESFVLTDDPRRLSEARCVIIAVPTPVDHHMLPDLSILRAACASAVQGAVPGQAIILTSTTYVGSTKDLLVTPLQERGFVVGQDIFVAFSPERINPGSNHHAHEDVPRVVGGATPFCASKAAEILGVYALNVHQVSSPEVAETTKLFENTFRAVNIALANEFAEISRTLQIDVLEVVQAAATKPYGFMPFFPGPGVGGHCIPCDPHYLLWQLRAQRLPAPIIEHAMSAIAGRPLRVVNRVSEVLSANGRGIVGARVLVVGVAYKPDVEDVRESPALEILDGLVRAGAEVAFHDPLIETVHLRNGWTVRSVPHPASFKADIVVLHTWHTELDLTWIHEAPLILDTSYRLQDLRQRVAL
jgi:nucleotide sugar dehydrogenase